MLFRSPDGKVALHLGSQGMGQGVHAIYPKLVAQKLGIALSQVVLVTGDSDVVPGSVPTVASRTTMMAGTATTLACDESIRRGLPWAAQALEASVQDLRFESGRYVVAGTDHGIGVLEVAARIRSASSVPEG